MSSQQFLQVTVILKKYGASFCFFHGTAGNTDNWHFYRKRTRGKCIDKVNIWKKSQEPKCGIWQGFNLLLPEAQR
jgi:hypothetical protein